MTELATETIEIDMSTRTILVVEDEDAVRKLLRAILRRTGYTVIEASDGREALAIAEAHEGSIDLLLSDVVMPHMGGFALADALRSVRPNAKVLLMSGYTDADTLGEPEVRISHPLLEKPFSPDHLKQVIAEMLAG